MPTMIERQDVDLDQCSLVRPFTLTKGRTRPVSGPVPVEAVIGRTALPGRTAPTLSPVESEIYRLAGERLSVAEMSARLHLPLGVVRVLIGDLVHAGHLLLGPTATTNDASLIKRLIRGIRAL